MEKTICELFAGVGGFRLGFERLESGWKTVWFSQWEPGTKKQWAHNCYVKHFGDSQDNNGEYHTNENISTVDKTAIPDHTLLVGGFPCLDENTIVKTDRGERRIKEISSGDLVLSHDGEYHKVINVFDQGMKDTYKITIPGCSPIYATDNHRFYVKEITMMTQLGLSKWVSVRDMMFSNKRYAFAKLNERGEQKIWTQAISIVRDQIRHVYDIEVNDTHSFVANGVITHNCQDYSVAHSLSSSKGIEGKKGVLWWQIRDTLIAKNPPFCLFENVDRLLKSPANQRGRDFGVILACLNDLGYDVEWRVINAAVYGAAQRRRRTFIFAYNRKTAYAKRMRLYNAVSIISENGIFAKSFPIKAVDKTTDAYLPKDIIEVSNSFKFGFENAGFMRDGIIYTSPVTEISETPIPLNEILQSNVDERYYIPSEKVSKWEYIKGAKKIPRKSADGHEYIYSEGPMPFPDYLDKPGRTMLTSEGTLNRCTHIVSDPETKRLRILTPVEAERLQGFDDDWTNIGMPQRMRYFCMGNALVVPIITRIGKELDAIVAKEP